MIRWCGIEMIVIDSEILGGIFGIEYVVRGGVMM